MIRKLILLLTVASVCGLASGCGVLVVGGAATAASVVHDRRTAGTVVEDQAIEIKAYQALKSRSDRLANSHINATSYDNDVLLTGEVPSPEASRWAEETVASLDKVGKVYNELAVRPPSSLAERSNDAWITAKAKASLLGIK
ncbi:MAG: BON domain-containing protein, partial [Candidatus Competibacterales bacterium]|nr:BON domain-containing protein [Candidatus Competibacterales bacterium]